MSCVWGVRVLVGVWVLLGVTYILKLKSRFYSKHIVLWYVEQTIDYISIVYWLIGLILTMYLMSWLPLLLLIIVMSSFTPAIYCHVLPYTAMDCHVQPWIAMYCHGLRPVIYGSRTYLTTAVCLCAGLLAYLLSKECNIFNPKWSEVTQDMDQPLSHYFINSSHKT